MLLIRVDYEQMKSQTEMEFLFSKDQFKSVFQDYGDFRIEAIS